MLDDLATAATKLECLREHGIAVAIDDFGTGFTSITQLRRLPVDILKIDRAYTSRASLDPKDAAIVKLIIDTGHLLGFAVLDRHQVDKRRALTVMSTLIYPRSRGSLRLASADASTAPLIDMNYLAEQGDQQVLAEGVEIIREIMKSAAFGGNVTAELQEGVMKTRMQPIGNAWQKLPRIVRDLSAAGGTVLFIGTKKQGEMTYTVVIRPDAHEERLRWNMTASVTIVPAE